MKLTTVIFDSSSVINNKTDIDNFIPPNPGWNYVRIKNNPEDPDKHTGFCGKWLLFIPNREFISVFRKIAKLAKELKLTHCFKASGSPGRGGEHVFCIYCSDYRQIYFVRKIAETLLSGKFLEKYSYTYKDGTKAIYFKTDNATHYKSNARGLSLTLFKFTNQKELFVKEFHDGKPTWKLVTNDNNQRIADNFENHLMMLEINETDVDL